MAIRFLPLFAAAFANFFVGGFFYSFLFANAWFEGMCRDKGNRTWVEKALKKRPMLLTMMIDFSLGFLQSYVLAHADLGTGDVTDALSTAFWLWLGMMVPLEVSESMWGDRDPAVVGINLTKQLTGLCAQALVLSAVPALSA